MRKRRTKAQIEHDNAKAGLNLPLRRELLAEAYIANGGNGTQAARAAGYVGNDASLAATASRALKDVKVQEYRRRRLTGVKAHTDEIHYLLADHLRANLGDFVDCLKDDGSLDLEKAQAKGVAHLVKELDCTTTYDEDGNKTVKTKLKLHDSQTAAKVLADIHGLKQMPRENEIDNGQLAIAQAKARQCYEYLLTRCESEEDALAVMGDRYPNLRQHLELPE